MADWVRSTGRSRGRVITWDTAGWRRRAPAWADQLSDFGRATADRLRNWAAVDSGPGRLMPWLPIAFGLGIAIYFSAEREPDWRAALALAVGAALGQFSCAAGRSVFRSRWDLPRSRRALPPQHSRPRRWHTRS